jgi:hypothetical protein
MSIDDRYPNPRTFLRHAIGLDVPSPTAVLDRARRGSGNADVGDLTTGDLQLLEARRELQAAQARLKHLEAALRAAGRVLAPYLGNGRS